MYSTVLKNGDGSSDDDGNDDYDEYMMGIISI